METFWPYFAGFLVGCLMTLCVLLADCRWFARDLVEFRKEQKAFYEQQNKMYVTLDRVLDAFVRIGVIEVVEKEKEPLENAKN